MRDSHSTEAWVDGVTFRIRLQKLHSLPAFEDPQISTSGPSTSTTHTIMPSDCEVIRSSAPSLARIRNLSPSGTILLFTPVIMPSSLARTASKTDQDPFELFGRALSQYHPRLQHVPYVPKVGFTATHGVFLSQADAVIVVNCEPAEGVDSSLSKQADFAEGVIDYLDDNRTASSARTSLVLVQFGDDRFRDDVPAFENVLQSDEYSPQTAKLVAQLLFKGRS